MNLGQGNVSTGVCDSVHTGCVSTRHPLGANNTSVPDHPSGMATVAGSKHPTGLHSCIVHFCLFIGWIQRLFWRKDRHCFFLNWLVIVDVRGFVVYSRPGFVGHLHDLTCYRHINIPPFPQGL